MTEIPLYQVDAFTGVPFKGNPAGVCLLPGPQSAEWMRNVAAEMNLSETAFLVKRPEGFDLRWFTPTVEIELCGHATLASAHILYEKGIALAGDTLQFHTLSGILRATQSNGWTQLDFPVRTFTRCNESEAVTAALKAVPEECYQSGENMMCVFEDESLVRQLHPDFAALAHVPCHGIIVTAPAQSMKYDFVSRFFAPAIGINEDPVTGSSHCTLAPYWQARLHKDYLKAYQASARGGELGVHVSGARVYISGQAITVFEARLRA
jgi:PhzF family phenazine biosynthesis protein